MILCWNLKPILVAYIGKCHGIVENERSLSLRDQERCLLFIHILSNLNYCSEVWIQCSNRCRAKLEQVNERALQYIPAMFQQLLSGRKIIYFFKFFLCLKSWIFECDWLMARWWPNLFFTIQKKKVSV